ncbi:NADH-quinone oxidoreductase subunit NuoK [bacterium]|nr:NADH-quinone oxidoreductase subunit NuoK [bacterium]
MIPLYYYLIISCILFSVGVIGVMIRKNVIIVLISIELMMNAANLALITFSKHFDMMDGQIIAFIALTIAAAETAVGLAIMVCIYRDREKLNIDDINILKW